MKFIKKATEVLTGKTEQERLQERETLKQIRKEANVARLRTKKEEAIKYAQELEKLRYQRRLEQAKEGRSFGGINLGLDRYSSIIKQPKEVVVTKPITKRKPTKKTRIVYRKTKPITKRKPTKKTRIVYRKTKAEPERRYDVIGW